MTTAQGGVLNSEIKSDIRIPLNNPLVSDFPSDRTRTKSDRRKSDVRINVRFSTCLACGQPKSEHTTTELAGGCKNQPTMHVEDRHDEMAYLWRTKNASTL